VENASIAGNRLSAFGPEFPFIPIAEENSRRSLLPGWEKRKGQGNGKHRMEKKHPFVCPVCGRKTDYPIEELFEGANLTCPFCKLVLTLHGHMWKDVQKEMQKVKEKS
jgi:hypothetical protein